MFLLHNCLKKRANILGVKKKAAGKKKKKKLSAAVVFSSKALRHIFLIAKTYYSTQYGGVQILLSTLDRGLQDRKQRAKQHQVYSQIYWLRRVCATGFGMSHKPPVYPWR